jgi:cathepsin E
LLVALTAAAKPIVIDSFVTLPISRRVNFTGTRTLLERDLARVSHLRDRAAAKLSGRAIVNEPIDNQAVTYVVSKCYSRSLRVSDLPFFIIRQAAVGVGSPATTCNICQLL